MRVSFLLALLAASEVAAAVPRFSDRLDYAGLPELAIAAADFNRDGLVDVVAVGGYTGFLLLGKGDGTFETPLLFSLNVETGSVAAADLNGDGIPDLVLTASSGGANPAGVAVALGLGDGSFAPATFYQIGSKNLLVNMVDIGDFDGDGFLDVMTVGDFLGNGSDVSTPFILRGAGDGTLLAPQRVPVSCRDGVATNDINKDGLTDLVVVLNGSFATLLSNGDGTFQQINTKTNIAASGTNVTVADVNGDGLLDVSLTNINSNSVYLFFGHGDGTFQAAGAVSVPGGRVLQVGDVNNDGVPDLVSNGVYVALGKGSGTFQAPVYYPVASGPTGLYAAYQAVLADTRNLGRLDVIVLDNLSGLSVLLNQGNGTYEDGVVTRVSGTPSCGAAADFNRDGKPDVALGNGSGIAMLFGTGKANQPFTKGPVTTIANALCPVAGDLNNDGIPDLLVTVSLPPPANTITEYSYLGNGDGTLRQAGASVVSKYGAVVVLADFNHDGKLDYATSGNALALGNGDGTFQTPVPFIPTDQLQNASLSGVVAGDLNGDGYPDLVASDGTHQNLYVLLNDGKGGWQETIQTVNSGTCYFPTGYAIADVTGDGHPDLVVGCYDFTGLLYAGSAAGKLSYFGALTDSAVGTPIAVVADVNGDGIPDIEFVTSYSIGVFVGQGGGAFAAPFYLGTGPTPGIPLPMNLHGQGPGLADFVVPDASGRVLSIINQTKP